MRVQKVAATRSTSTQLEYSQDLTQLGKRSLTAPEQIGEGEVS